MNIVILAAGVGKRMQSALPKVLHPLAGQPLLAHVLQCARSLQPRRLVLVVGHGAEVVRETVQATASSTASASTHAADDLLWVEQFPQLGTGHAVMQALPHLDDSCPTLVLYGDVPLIRPATLQRLAAAANTAAGAGVAVLTVHLADASGYGRIVRAADGSVARIVEHKDATEAERAIHEVNTGMMMVPTLALKGWLARLSNHNAQGEYYLTDIIAMAVADGVAVHSAQPDAEWETLGVNSKRQLADLERRYQLNAAEQLLDAGVTLADPARIDVRGTLACGQDVSIDINCIFSGTVTLGNNVRIGAHCVLRDVTLAEGTVVEPYSHLDGAQVGANSRIGPYARLRPGAQLAEDVHIGNFVEVKNATIAAHSKANHLAYLGDASIGTRVNIGAGTITCNYDGVNKHRTEIGDDVFVGSDTQLVAPVKVGNGATLGAGTTLTKDAPAGQLTVSRARQMSLAAWKRPEKIKK